MVTGDLVDLNLTMSPYSRKIPALLAKNSAQPCQIESCGEIMWIRMRPIDDDDDDDVRERPRWPTRSPNNGRKKKVRLRGEGDQVKFIDLRFKRGKDVVGCGKGRGRQHVL